MSEAHYFLREDLDALDRSIDEIDNRIKDILSQAGDSCKGRSDTWHDNFEHEDGRRSSFMWSTRLKELVAIKKNAKIVTPAPTGDEVVIGRTVIIRDEETQEISTFRVGSYMVLGDHEDQEVISYAAPLAKIIIGARAGDLREGQIGRGKKRFKIIEVR